LALLVGLVALAVTAAAIIAGSVNAQHVHGEEWYGNGWHGRGTYGYAGGDPEDGKRIAEAKCASCHGAEGNSTNPQYPKLAGQNPAYLYWQIWAFKTGARRSDVMSGIVAALSDADTADAASFYAEQAIHPDPIEDRVLASVGKRIFFAGAGPGMVPPCAMCHASGGRGHMPMMMGMMGHGMRGHRMMTSVPNLNGQHATYSVDQLYRFASGERQGPMMNRVAAALSGADKKAVAEYLSGSPVY
jgi:cytochrome c553